MTSLIFFLGKDLIVARIRAKKKLVSDNEMNILLEQIESNLGSFITAAEDSSDYTVDDAVNIRDNLIAAGAIRLSRRSKEIMMMTMEEVGRVEEIDIAGESMYIIKVRKLV